MEDTSFHRSTINVSRQFKNRFLSLFSSPKPEICNEVYFLLVVCCSSRWVEVI